MAHAVRDVRCGLEFPLRGRARRVSGTIRMTCRRILVVRECSAVRVCPANAAFARVLLVHVLVFALRARGARHGSRLREAASCTHDALRARHLECASAANFAFEFRYLVPTRVARDATAGGGKRATNPDLSRRARCARFAGNGTRLILVVRVQAARLRSAPVALEARRACGTLAIMVCARSLRLPLRRTAGCMRGTGTVR